MAKALLLAWASPANGESDAEFNQWYDETHIPQVREAIPAVVVVNRYRLTDPAAPATPAAVRYLAIYELDDTDVGAAAGLLGGALSGGRLDMSPAVDMGANPPDTQWYQHV